MPSQQNTLNERIPIPLSPEEIDQQIITHIESATSENSDVWTCREFDKREYLRCFFQYPAMMVPAVQKKLIEIVLTAKPDTTNVIDPFMGSATSLISCMEFGLDCFGQDINPLAVLISKARTGPYYTDAVSTKYEELLNRVERDRSTKIEADFPTLDKWFKPAIAVELSKLVRAIRKEPRLAVRRFFWVVLAETVRVSSNDRTSTFKLHMRKQEEIDKRTFSAIDVFKLHVEESIEDYESHASLLICNGQLTKNGSYKGSVDTRLWNSKHSIYTPTGGPFYKLMVTSPPYGDNHTTVPYGQHSFLPLQWIDLQDIDSKANETYISSGSAIDSMSLGGRKSRLDEMTLHHLFEVSPTFSSTYAQIKRIAPDKLKKVAAFVLDLNKTIENIFTVMLTDSYQIWTLGNRTVAGIEIPNSSIVTELIEYHGGYLVTQLEREIINKRMAKRNNNSTLMNYEDILIFRKVG